MPKLKDIMEQEGIAVATKQTESAPGRSWRGLDTFVMLEQLLNEQEALKERVNSIEQVVPKPESPEERERRELREQIAQIEESVKKLREDTTDGLKGNAALARAALASVVQLHGVSRDYWRRSAADRLSEAVPNLILTVVSNMDQVSQLISDGEAQGITPGQVILGLARDMANHKELPEAEVQALLNDPESVQKILGLVELHAEAED